MLREDLIKRLRDIGIVKQGNFHLKSGGNSNNYYNIKGALGFPNIRERICEMLWSKVIRNSDLPTCIASQGYGGIPLGTALSHIYDLNFTMVREKEKSHGIGSLIEGYSPNERDRIIIVDDVFTTGRSLLEIMEALKTLRAKILGAYVVVKRGENDIGIKVDYLFRPDDFI